MMAVNCARCPRRLVSSRDAVLPPCQNTETRCENYARVLTGLGEDKLSPHHSSSVVSLLCFVGDSSQSLHSKAHSVTYLYERVMMLRRREHASCFTAFNTSDEPGRDKGRDTDTASKQADKSRHVTEGRRNIQQQTRCASRTNQSLRTGPPPVAPTFLVWTIAGF